jgi:hypothetical protein
MTTKAAPKLPSGQIVKWRGDEFPSYYSNLMAFGMSPFDISITFGEIGNATSKEVEGVPRAKIILSPEQAANLMKLLGLALSNYVQNNGTLRMSGSVDLEAVSNEMKTQLSKGSKEHR